MILTREIIKELIHYNPHTGVLTWRKRNVKWCKNKRGMNIFNARFAGEEAGSVFTRKNERCYRIVYILGEQYYAHRIAWLYMTGRFPEQDTDHKDGDGLNNKFRNLRSATRTVNNRNLGLSKNNTSGTSGVCPYKKTKRWRAYICDKSKAIHLGVFDRKKDAIAARKRAEIDYGYGY